MFIVMINYTEACNRNNTASLWTLQEPALAFARATVNQEGVRDVLVFDGELLHKLVNPAGEKGVRKHKKQKEIK